MAIIKPKHGTTAPASGLAQYELAVDTTNKRVYIGNDSGGGDLIGSAPGGSNTQIQYNNSSNFGGSANFTFDGTNLQIGSQGDLRLGDSDSSNYIALQAPATVSNNNIYTLPSAVGSANQVLQIASVAGNDATLQWATVSGGSGTPGGSDTYVQFNDGSTFGGDAGLTYNKTTDSLTMAGDLAVNGGDITTTTSTATIFNTTATTVSAFGAATTCTLGYSGTSSSTTNIATGVMNSGQTKTINIGTNGGGSSRNTLINIGTGNGYIFLGSASGTYIGEAGGATPTILYVDYIQNYSSSITITSVGNGIALDDTGSIQIGDVSANGDGTLLLVRDSQQAVQVSSSAGLQLQAQTQLRFYDADDTNYVGFKAPATVAADKMWILPSADGTSGQVLSTNGSGTLSWATRSSVYGVTATIDFSENINGLEIVISGTGESLSTSLKYIETLTSISVQVNTYSCTLVSIKSFYDATNGGWCARLIVKPPFTGNISAETIYLESISSVSISGNNGTVLTDDTWTSIVSSSIYHQEETYVTKTLTGLTWVTADMFLTCKVLGLTSTDHTPEDAILEGVRFEINNIVAGTGFDIIGHAPEGTYGKYTIKCLGQ